MTTNWKKRYSFRLTEDDTSIHEFLEQLPSNKRSEAIRYLLGIGVRYLNVEQHQQHDFKKLMQEINDIKVTQMKHYEQLIHQLQNKASYTTEKQEGEKANGDMSDQAIADTANAFLSSFGISHDN